MRKFKVYVDGQPYEVVVEEIKEQAAQPKSAPPAPAQHKEEPAAPAATPPPAPKKEEKAAPAPAAPAASGGASIPAPMPGNVIDIKVKVGDSVNEGDTLMILEAMKMENEVSSPASGVVKSINVAVGASVNTGDVMITLE